jgi:hypothetical protein
MGMAGGVVIPSVGLHLVDADRGGDSFDGGHQQATEQGSGCGHRVTPQGRDHVTWSSSALKA